MAKKPLYPHITKSKVTPHSSSLVKAGDLVRVNFFDSMTMKNRTEEGTVTWVRADGLVDVKVEKPIRKRVTVPVEEVTKLSQAKPLAKLTRDDVDVLKWFERDRQHIEVKDKKTGETVAEWWDESVSEMAEDGFFYIPRPLGWRIPAEQHKMDESVLEYLEDMGTLVKA